MQLTVCTWVCRGKARLGRGGVLQPGVPHEGVVQRQAVHQLVRQAGQLGVSAVNLLQLRVCRTSFNIDSKQQRMAQIQLFCLGLDVRSVLPMSGPMALHCSSSLGSSGGSASPVVGSASWSRPSSSQILASSIVCWAGKVTCSSAQNCVVHTS